MRDSPYISVQGSFVLVGMQMIECCHRGSGRRLAGCNEGEHNLCKKRKEERKLISVGIL